MVTEDTISTKRTARYRGHDITVTVEIDPDNGSDNPLSRDELIQLIEAMGDDAMKQDVQWDDDHPVPTVRNEVV